MDELLAKVEHRFGFFDEAGWTGIGTGAPQSGGSEDSAAKSDDRTASVAARVGSLCPQGRAPLSDP